MSLDLDAARDARCRTAAAPGQRDDSAVAIALKLDRGLDRRRNRSGATGEEAVAICWIQRANNTGFIEGDELVLSRELIPHLKVEEGILLPLIGAGILAKRLLVHRPNNGRLSAAERSRGSDQQRDDRCANTCHSSRNNPAGSMPSTRRAGT